MSRWIVVDLDGTLCDCSGRSPLAREKKWVDFHEGIPNDPPHLDVLDLLNDVWPKRNIIAITGRPETHKAATVRWCFVNRSDFFNGILMRPAGDLRPDHELKLDLIDGFFGSRKEALKAVSFILEDRDSVVEAYRNAGFNCWQVRPGSF